jgi:hypothetical protein
MKQPIIAVLFAVLLGAAAAFFRPGTMTDDGTFFFLNRGWMMLLYFAYV